MRNLFCLLLVTPSFAWAQHDVIPGRNKLDANNLNYSVELNAYKRGCRDYKSMSWLATTARSLKQEDLANKIAHEYINEFLLKLSEDSLFTRDNIGFIRRFNQSSNDKSFQVFYQNPDKIDRIMGIPNYTQSYIDYIIAKEEIYPKLRQKSDSDWSNSQNIKWKEIGRSIKKKYNWEYARRVVLDAQIKWSEYRKDSIALTMYTIKKIKKYGLDTAGFGKVVELNNIIYGCIFRYSNKVSDLKRGLEWMKLLLDKEPANPGFMDTYANILYKLGRRKEAIMWERKAVALAPKDAGLNDSLRKMENLQPTWL